MGSSITLELLKMNSLNPFQGGEMHYFEEIKLLKLLKMCVSGNVLNSTFQTWKISYSMASPDSV